MSTRSSRPAVVARAQEIHLADAQGTVAVEQHADVHDGRVHAGRSAFEAAEAAAAVDLPRRATEGNVAGPGVGRGDGGGAVARADPPTDAPPTRDATTSARGATRRAAANDIARAAQMGVATSVSRAAAADGARDTWREKT